MTESTHHMSESKWSNTRETRSRQTRDFQWWFSRTDLLCQQHNTQNQYQPALTFVQLQPTSTEF